MVWGSHILGTSHTTQKCDQVWSATKPDLGVFSRKDCTQKAYNKQVVEEGWLSVHHTQAEMHTA